MKHILNDDLFQKFLLLENLIDHANTELQLSGLLDQDSDYNGLIGKACLELINTFSKQGHSGFSAQLVLDVFNKLARFKNLTDITNNPDEWTDVTEYGNGDILFQNKRNPTYFSNDGGKTYWNLDDKIKRFYEVP